MRIEGILWLEEIVDKLWRKHRVEPDEVVEAITGSAQFRWVERGHQEGEDLYAALGRTEAGRRLIVFFVLKQTGDALIVSARDMTRAERKRYERK